MDQGIKRIKDIIYKDLSLREFCNKHNFTDEEFLQNFGKLVMQKDNNAICDPCNGKNCRMDPFGMQTKIVYDTKIDITYFRCPKLVEVDHTHLDMLYFPNSEDFDQKELIFNGSRAFALRYMKEFKNNYQKGKFIKGIYFNGSFGTGKTFLMYTLAKDLAKKGVNVLIAYYPDLVRFIKSTIANNQLEKTINKLKYVEVLMLDDIGAEGNSNFIRDEVLGPILQFRLQSNLPVCMTSNYNLNSLKEHFTESRDEINKVKSDRIIERIRYLTNQVELDDVNYRNQAL